MLGILSQFFSEKRSVEQGEVGLDATKNPPMAETNGESDLNSSPGTQHSDEMDVDVSTDAGPGLSNPVIVSSTEAVTDSIDEGCEHETQTIVNQPCDVVISQGTESIDEGGGNETQTIVKQPCDVVTNQETEVIEEWGENETQAIVNQPCEVVINQETENKRANAPVVDALDAAPEVMSDTDKGNVMTMKTRSSSRANKKHSNGTAAVTRRRKRKSNTFTEHSDSGEQSKGDINAPDCGLVNQGRKRRPTPKQEHPPALEEQPVENVKAKRGRRPRATKPEPSALETPGPIPEISENGLQQPSGSTVNQLENTERESTEIPSEECVPEMGTPSVSDRLVAPKRRRVQKQEDGSGHERRTTRSRKNASEVEPAFDAPHKESEVSSLDSPTVRPTRRASHAAVERISYQIAEGVVSDDEETSREEKVLSPSKTKSSGEKRIRSSKGEVSSADDVVLATPSSTVQPTDLDVRCIRSTSHPRTKVFWDLLVKYASASPSLSCNDIVEKIKHDILPGRFLRTDANGCSTVQTEEQIDKMIGNAVKKYWRSLKVVQVECSNDDVISAKRSKHPGNIRFEFLVAKYMQESPTMTTPDLVELVKKGISPGRFLAKGRFGWCPLTEAKIIARVANQKGKRPPVTGFHCEVASTHMTSPDQNTTTTANTNDEVEIPQTSLSVSHVTTAARVIVEQDAAKVIVEQDAARVIVEQDAAKVIVEQDAAKAARSEARDELEMKDTADLLSSYVEDIAWRKFATEGPAETVRALPPPGPLPELMTETDEPSCTWSFDEETRVLRATLKPEVDTLSQKAKDYLLLMMERDDIAVITSGFCRGLEGSLWNDQGINSTSGEMYHHRFRRFVRIQVDGTTSGNSEPTPRYEEIDRDLSMKIGDYFKYLEGRLKLLQMPGEKESVERHLSYTNALGEATTLDVDEVIYMLDYDIKRKLPLHYQNFKDRFLFPEILPGGSMCAMNAVNEAARPDMGPNLYVTPPGSFTRFHQDGYGTVDSGHLCLSGYNEVVMLRRLPKGHDINALHADVNGFFEMPHADLLGKKASDWPSKAQIKRMASFNYCPIVLILKPGEHLHIGKGRFHAFRKLGPETLPDDDCHSELRKEMHLALNLEELATCVNFSIAWDWSFLGCTPAGINREMTTTLEMALRNRKLSKPKHSLAIPKLCLLACCKSSIAALRSGRSTFGINTTIDTRAEQRHRNILKGLLPTLEFVISQEQETFRTSGSDQVSHELRPHSWENPVVFPLDPYGNSDYFCKICFQELSNTYLHCSGCEDLLKKDFNICAECHSASRHRQFVVMNDKDYTVDSSLNHTGAFSQTNPSCGKCKVKERCGSCLRGRSCCCICHESFTIQQRMWNCETLSDMLEAAKKLVGGDNIPFYAEVIPRLEEARFSKDIETLHVEQVAFFGNSFGPADHLDISAESLALTTPLATVEFPSTSGTKFAVEFSARELKEFITNARNSQDVNCIPGMQHDVALQLFRNFSDCEETELMEGVTEGTLRFSRRELDIIAFAIMQALAGVPSPCPGRLSTSVRGDWGAAAWHLMPYRDRKSVIDKFYKRTTSNIEDKLPLKNAEYINHLQSKVSSLFASAAKK